MSHPVQDWRVTIISVVPVKLYHVGGGMSFTVTLTFSNCMLKVYIICHPLLAALNDAILRKGGRDLKSFIKYRCACMFAIIQ